MATMILATISLPVASAQDEAGTSPARLTLVFTGSGSPQTYPTPPAAACGGEVRAYAMMNESSTTSQTRKAYSTASFPAQSCFTRFDGQVGGPLQTVGLANITLRIGCDQATLLFPEAGNLLFIDLYRGMDALGSAAIRSTSLACGAGEVHKFDATIAFDKEKLARGGSVRVDISHYWTSPNPDVTGNVHFVVGSQDKGSFITFDLASTAVEPGPTLGEVPSEPVPSATPETAATAARAAAGSTSHVWLVWAPISTGLLLAGKFFGPRLGFALYARIASDRLEHHPTRRAILERVSAEPGIRFRSLCDRLELHRATARFHVGVLTSAGLIRSFRMGRHDHLAPTTGVHLRAVQEDAASCIPSVSRIIEAVKAQPGILHRDLAHRTGLARSSLSWHMRRLARLELVRVERRGRDRMYFLLSSWVGAS